MSNSERLSNINPEAFNNDKCAHEILLNQLIIAFEHIETLEKKIAELERQLAEQPGKIKEMIETRLHEIVKDLNDFADKI